MASNLIASSGTKLAAVGAQGRALSHLRSFSPAAANVLPVAVQGSASFPLRWSAAIRFSPLPQRAKTGDAQEGSDSKECEAYEVHNFVSSWAQHAIYMLLNVISLSQEKEDVETAAELIKHFSRLIATAGSEGEQLDRAAAVRGLIAGAHCLVELAYRTYKCPRLSAPTTAEVFVDFFISNGQKGSESSTGFAHEMKLCQVPEADQHYLGSMEASMKLTKAVVDGLRTEPYTILQMFPTLDEEDLKGLSDSPFPKGFPWTGIFY